MSEPGAEPGNSSEERDVSANKPRCVSFNKDVHIKRYGSSRESLQSEPQVRKEPFTHLSEQQLIDEADKIRAEAESLTCTTDNNPEKFYSLPHKKKVNNTPKSESPGEKSKPIVRSTSDVGNKKKGKERTSISTLFRKANRSTSPEVKSTVAIKKKTPVKRSKSDVSDLKSNTKLIAQPKPIRKRSGSESEGNINSMRNKKSQLSPIIETATQREDYFTNTDVKKEQDPDKSKETIAKKYKVNPVEKPPRFKSPEKANQPKPPVRSKKLIKPITEKPKVTEIKIEKPKSIENKSDKDETDSQRTYTIDTDDIAKPITPEEAKQSIRESIDRLRSLSPSDNEMSSYLTRDKSPFNKGPSVERIVEVLKEDDQEVQPPKLLSPPPRISYNNQPFSYTKPDSIFYKTEKSLSPDIKMNDESVVYAQVVSNKNEDGPNKQTIHKTYSPTRYSEDEGYGYESLKSESNIDRSHSRMEEKYSSSFDSKNLIDSPITPKYKNSSAFDELNTSKYSNEFSSFKKETEVNNGKFRGHGDGSDTRKKLNLEIERDNNFNELSYRRELLESRTNARMMQPRTRTAPLVSKYFAESDPINYENKIKATEDFVSETAKYFDEIAEKTGFTENYTSSEYKTYNNDKEETNYKTESRTYEKLGRDEIDKKDIIERNYKFDDIKHYNTKERSDFPPEPEYEPPSLDVSKPLLEPEEYVEKKYKVKSRYIAATERATQIPKPKPRISQENLRKERKQYIETKFESKQPENYGTLQKIDHKKDENYRTKKDYSYDIKTKYVNEHDVDYNIENDISKTDEYKISNLYNREESNNWSPSAKLIKNEKRHTEARYESDYYTNKDLKNRHYDHRVSNERYESRDMSPSEDIVRQEKRVDRVEASPTRPEKVESKPPKAKKLSGLEKVKQLFSTSSKKSKTEKEEELSSSRVLKSPERVSDDEYRKSEAQERELRRRYKEYRGSSDGWDSDHVTGVRTAQDDGVRHARREEYRVAEKYSQRRRMETPSPTPSPTRDNHDDLKGSWFKSLDRLSRKRTKASKVERDVKTEDELSDNRRTPKVKESSRSTYRYADNNGYDSDRLINRRDTQLNNKSYSLTNLHRKEPADLMTSSYHEERSYRRNLQNISESETETHHRRHNDKTRASTDKPPVSPYERRSRSSSNSKVTSKKSSPLQSSLKNGSKQELRSSSRDVRGSKQELRGSKHDVRSSRHGSAAGHHSGGSSTEGESSRSAVYLHATTVGEIPDPDVMRRSRENINSTSPPYHVKHVSRSFSLLAPWRPRHHSEEYDVNYAQTVKTPHHKSTSLMNGHSGQLQNNSRSQSQSTLIRKKPSSRLTSSSSNIYKKSRHGSSKENIDTTNTRTMPSRRNHKSMSTEILARNSDSDREVHFTRSTSMPRNDNKKTNWFKMTNKNKKSENSRVR